MTQRWEWILRSLLWAEFRIPSEVGVKTAKLQRRTMSVEELVFVGDGLVPHPDTTNGTGIFAPQNGSKKGWFAKGSM